MTRFPPFQIELPSWVEGQLPPEDYVFRTLEERMELSIHLARQNVKHHTGGPFAAVVFDCQTNRLLAPGVNTVVASKWSGAHGEMLAIAIAQKLIGTHDLGAPGLPAYELVTSTEPCSMCCGATPWSGIKRLVCGAREEDARSIGFDEGPKPDNWIETLESRGIEVQTDILRHEAANVLREYKDSGGHIYNGGRGTSL